MLDFITHRPDMPLYFELESPDSAPGNAPTVYWYTGPGDPYGQDPGDTTVNDPYVPAPTADPQTDVAGKTTPVSPVGDQPQVLGGETERTAPAPTASPAPAEPGLLGGLLPHTGAGILGEATLAMLLMAAGVVLRLFRRRPAEQN